jgi:hypothetical protein
MFSVESLCGITTLGQFGPPLNLNPGSSKSRVQRLKSLFGAQGAGHGRQMVITHHPIHLFPVIHVKSYSHLCQTGRPHQQVNGQFRPQP